MLSYHFGKNRKNKKIMHKNFLKKEKLKIVRYLIALSCPYSSPKPGRAHQRYDHNKPTLDKIFRLSGLD
jgi:hypothetical protein